MVDPLSTALTAAKIAVPRDKSDGLVKRILGPTADLMGSDLANWYENRSNRILEIADSAERKLGRKLDEDGSVPSRLVAMILGEGSYCDDQLMVEYLGGVLASSRTHDGRDDRGSRWVGLITSLSSYEIRLHYLLYSAAMQMYVEKGLEISWGDTSAYPAGDVSTVFDFADIVECMEFSSSESASEILPESMFALDSESLITDWYILPKHNFVNRQLKVPWDAALGFQPTPRGIQLFMWAQGIGPLWIQFGRGDITFPDIECPVPVGISLNEAHTSPESA